MLEKTRRKCWDYRNRVYPEDQWPANLHTKRAESLASRDRVLLEVGCGREATWLREVAPLYGRAIGVDMEISPQAARESDRTLLVGDAHRLPVRSESVDVVACADVLEHLAEPAACFAEFARVLRPGGHVILGTVNKWFPPIVAARWMPHRLRQQINRIVSGTAEADTFPAYYRANTVRALRNLAQGASLRPVTLEYVSHHPTYFLFSYVVYRVAVFFEQIIRRHHRLGFLCHMIHADLAILSREESPVKECSLSRTRPTRAAPIVVAKHPYQAGGQHWRRRGSVREPSCA